MSVLLETTLGDIVIDLLTNERPRACLNFLKLCKIKYYNYCLFHSVQQNFLAQTGDPTGRGTGGEAVFRFLYGDQARYFEAEVKPRIKHKKRGTVSMANNGENLHGSQFFITLGEDLDYLDGVHTVFGEVVEGFDVLDKINEAICDEEHRPYQDIRINHTVIIDDPYDDPSDLPIPDRSPEPTKEQLDSGRIGADEEIDDTKGKTVEEIEEMMEERELKTGTQILEMVGDIPDADIKPPDNVLFVCKLNPVTRDEDLEIIFSRFGPIKSCEVIKEQKTGESLQYAFIEFENVEDCERAYFKMDNVLIDDRRIHVDFSQSVSKLKFQKQGAKPILPEKRSNNTAQLTLKDKAKKSNYDLVFDDEDDHQVKSNKGNKRDHDSSDEEGYKQEKNQDKKNRESSTRKQSKRDDYDFHNRKSKRKHESEDRGRRKGTRYYSTSSEEDSKEKKTKKPKEDVTLRPPKHSEDTRQREESRRKQNSEDYYRSRQQWDYSPRHKEKDKDRHSHNRDKQRHSEGHSGKQSSQDERRHRDRYRH